MNQVWKQKNSTTLNTKCSIYTAILLLFRLDDLFAWNTKANCQLPFHLHTKINYVDKSSIIDLLINLLFVYCVKTYNMRNKGHHFRLIISWQIVSKEMLYWFCSNCQEVGFISQISLLVCTPNIRTFSLHHVLNGNCSLMDDTCSEKYSYTLFIEPYVLLKRRCPCTVFKVQMD